MSPRYDRIRLVVCDETAESSTLKAGLTALGIKNVRLCDDTSSLLDSMEDGLVDLLLIDYDTGGDKLLKLTQDLRRKSRGRNPFVIVIATMSDSTLGTVRNILDGGVDDLIRKPYSTERLFGGIEKAAKSRKHFVASHDYVGPTRRAPNRDSADPSGLFEVPNTLHSKVYQDMGDEELQRMVDVAQFELDDRRLEASAVEVDQLAGKVLRAQPLPEKLDEVTELLERITEVAADLQRRTNDTAFHQVGNLAKMLLSLVGRIQQKLPQPITTESELLNKLAQGIRRAVTVERHAVDLMQEIVETVAGFTKRKPDRSPVQGSAGTPVPAGKST